MEVISTPGPWSMYSQCHFCLSVIRIYENNLKTTKQKGTSNIDITFICPVCNHRTVAFRDFYHPYYEIRTDVKNRLLEKRKIYRIIQIIGIIIAIIIFYFLAVALVRIAS